MPGPCICQGFIHQEAGWLTGEVGTTFSSPGLSGDWGLWCCYSTEVVVPHRTASPALFILQPLDVLRDFSVSVSVGFSKQLVISEARCRMIANKIALGHKWPSNLQCLMLFSPQFPSLSSVTWGMNGSHSLISQSNQTIHEGRDIVAEKNLLNLINKIHSK